MTHPDEVELRAQRPARALVVFCTFLALVVVLGVAVALCR